MEEISDLYYGWHGPVANILRVKKENHMKVICNVQVKNLNSSMKSSMFSQGDNMMMVAMCLLINFEYTLPSTAD